MTSQAVMVTSQFTNSLVVHAASSALLNKTAPEIKQNTCFLPNVPEKLTRVTADGDRNKQGSTVAIYI